MALCMYVCKQKLRISKKYKADTFCEQRKNMISILRFLFVGLNFISYKGNRRVSITVTKFAVFQFIFARKISRQRFRLLLSSQIFELDFDY